MAVSTALGPFGGTGNGSRNPGSLKGATVTPLPDPFTGQISQNRTGGYGYTYTNDILDSLQSEGVNNNQYQNLAKPGTPPPATQPPPSTGPGFDTGQYGPHGKPLPGAGLGTPLHPGNWLTGDGGGFYTSGPKDDRYVMPLGSGIPFGGGGQVFFDAASRMGLNPQGQPGPIPVGHIDPRTGKLVKAGQQGQGQPGNPLTHPMNMQNHPAVQAAASLGVPSWQTQQAMALGYHPMQTIPAQQALLQHPQNKQLHPHVAQHLLQGGSIHNIGGMHG